MGGWMGWMEGDGFAVTQPRTHRVFLRRVGAGLDAHVAHAVAPIPACFGLLQLLLQQLLLLLAPWLEAA